MRISDWSSDVCSSDLRTQVGAHPSVAAEAEVATAEAVHVANEAEPCRDIVDAVVGKAADQHGVGREPVETGVETLDLIERPVKIDCGPGGAGRGHTEIERPQRSEEHTSEPQSLMRTSYAAFCLKKKNEINNTN